MIDGALYAHGGFRERWAKEIAECALPDSAFRPPSKEFAAFIQPTLDRFNEEWQRHPLEERTWGLGQAARLDHALRYLGWTREEARGKVILDAGCGTAKLTCGMATWGGEVVGMDLAPGCVRGWSQRDALAGTHADRVHIVQGDLNAPPFRPGIFDGIHSTGVLHHTPNTRRAFERVAPLVRPGGSFGVWLYKQNENPLSGVPWLPFVRARWALMSYSDLRQVTTRLPPRVLYVLISAYAYLFHALYSTAARLRGRRHDQTARERTTSLFDSLAPPFDWKHNFEEVRGWFLEAGFDDVRDSSLPDDANGFAVTGRRSFSDVR